MTLDTQITETRTTTDRPSESTPQKAAVVDVDLYPFNVREGSSAAAGQMPKAPRSLSHHSGWLKVLADGLSHRTYLITAKRKNGESGFLPLSYVSSLLFGRYLVSLPYLNSAGVLTNDETIATALVDRAVQLADELEVQHLELRHERELHHPALTQTLTSKAHLRLALPDTTDALWKAFKPKVRNQIRKGEKQQFRVRWGSCKLLGDFYTVFSRNMRDLGTPVYGKRLFRSILEEFGQQAELCLLYDNQAPIAAAMLLHGSGVTEVPSASSLREYNRSNANMLMYWHLLQRAVEMKQDCFDFGRSTVDSNTYRFKRQWGAEPEPATWQYYVRHGSVGDLRLENGKYDQLVKVWKRLPVPLTRMIGPAIVRGIP